MVDLRKELEFGRKFCPHHFMHLFINLAGEMHVCCEAFDVKVDNIIDFNSIRYQELRKDSLSNKAVDHCNRCYRIEEESRISFRQLAIRDVIKHDRENLLAKQVQRFNEGIPLEPLSYDLRISNNCNLECKMCDAMHSSAIAKAQGILDPHHQRDIEVRPNTGAVRIYLTGGEPFLIKEYSKLLSEIDNLDCEIVVNTNATIITNTLLTQLRRFRDVNITLSIDGYGKLNELIRKNSRWEDVVKNIQIFRDSGFGLHVNTVVQKDNVNHLADLGTFLLSEKMQRWTLSELVEPREMHWTNVQIESASLELLQENPLVHNNVQTMSFLEVMQKNINNCT